MRISVTAGAAGSVSVAPRVPRSWAGSGAPSSSLGFTGDSYLRSNGDYYRRGAAGWGSPLFNLKGDEGEPGPTGPMGTPLTGTAAPSNGQGVDGQVYFRTFDDGSARSYYIKAAGAWGSPHDMRGPARAALATVAVTADRTIGESDLGKCLVVDSASTVTLTFPNTFSEAGWSVLVRRKGNGAVILAAGSGATIAFQYPGDDRIAKVNGTVTVDNINGATAWVVSEGTAAA